MTDTSSSVNYFSLVTGKHEAGIYRSIKILKCIGINVRSAGKIGHLKYFVYIDADLDLWWPLVDGEPGHEVPTSWVNILDLLPPSSASETDPLPFLVLAQALLRDLFSCTENIRVIVGSYLPSLVLLPGRTFY